MLHVGLSPALGEDGDSVPAFAIPLRRVRQQDAAA